MTFGLTQDELDYIEHNASKPLLLLGPKVWVFGSRARLSHHKFSDLGLLIEPKSEAIAVEVGKIREKLESENFPFKVDFVFDQDLAESYRPSVYRDKRKLF